MNRLAALLLLASLTGCALELTGPRGGNACGLAGERCCRVEALAARGVGGNLGATGCDTSLACIDSVCRAAPDAAIDAVVDRTDAVMEATTDVRVDVAPDAPDATLNVTDALDVTDAADSADVIVNVDATTLVDAMLNVAPDKADASDVMDASDAMDANDAPADASMDGGDAAADVRDGGDGDASPTDSADGPTAADVADVADVIDVADVVDVVDVVDACVSPRRTCGGLCVDVRTDDLNCGNCGRTCVVGEACRASRCVTCGGADQPYCGTGTCQTGFTACGDTCRNLSNNPSYCGTCSRACASTEQCIAGVCVACGRVGQPTCRGICDTGLTACGSTCRDLTNDASNCGVCARVCATGLRCETSLCGGAPEVAAGLTFTYAYSRTGARPPVAWGANGQAQLADGTMANRSLPTAMVGLGSTIEQVVGGGSHGCARYTDGTVRCWGNNGSGQLGDGTTTTRITPVRVPGLSMVTEIAAGGQHTCVLLADGVVWCWGSNVQGQLGDGTTNSRTSPVPVTGTSRYTHITAGSQHTCALRTDGYVACWGDNTNLQLATLLFPYRADPTVVLGISTVEEVVAGGQHTCARLTDGTVRCWGNNNNGQLGDASTATRVMPVTVRDASGMTTVNLAGVVQLGAGSLFSCARLMGGTVMCWGSNNFQQLGNVTVGARRNTAGPVTDVLNAQRLIVGGAHACVRLMDNTVRCWGYNANGQLGDGTSINRDIPVPVMGL